MTNIEECNIDATVGNGKKVNCELRGTVNMTLQAGEMFNFTEVLYVPQAVKNILSISRLALKGATMGVTKDKTTTNENGINMILDARKGINVSTMFYLKVKRYPPEGSKLKRQTGICQRKRKFKIEMARRKIGLKNEAYHMKWT